MQKLTSILIIIGFFAIVLKPVGPYLEYALNQEFIANNYCGNIARPEMKCNGSCYLMQRLQAEAENDSGDQYHQVEAGAEVILMTPVNDEWQGFASEYKQDGHPGAFLASIWDEVPASPPPRA